MQAGPCRSSLSQTHPKPIASLIHSLILYPCWFALLHHATGAPCWHGADPTQQSVLALLVFPSVTYHLGYHREELIGQSWYSLLHPEDTDLAATQHRAVGEC